MGLRQHRDDADGRHGKRHARGERCRSKALRTGHPEDFLIGIGHDDLLDRLTRAA